MSSFGADQRPLPKPSILTEATTEIEPKGGDENLRRGALVPLYC